MSEQHRLRSKVRKLCTEVREQLSEQSISANDIAGICKEIMKFHSALADEPDSAIEHDAYWFRYVTLPLLEMRYCIKNNNLIALYESL